MLQGLATILFFRGRAETVRFGSAHCRFIYGVGPLKNHTVFIGRTSFGILNQIEVRVRGYHL